MSSTLEIIFTGIVYLLGTANASGGRVQAILPAVMDPVIPFGDVIPEHTAYVKVNKDMIDESTAPSFSYTFQGEAFSVYILGDNPDHAGDTIVIQADDRAAQPKSTVIEPTTLMICKTNPCPNPIRLRYDDFVAHREEICSKCGTIDDQFTTSFDAHLVAARMVIDRGHLAAARPPGAMGTQWTLWHIKPARGIALAGKEQRLAEKVALDQTTSGAFTIVVRSLKESTKERHSIKLKSAASVEIGNMPISDLFLNPKHPEGVDHHFGLFYTMLQFPVPANPPLPITAPDTSLGPRDNCPPLADEKG